MKISVLLVLLGAIVPMVFLIAAIILDRQRRRNIEKPPQSEKLLRPPGHSLSIWLDEKADKTLDDLFISCGLSAMAGVFDWILAFSLSHHAPFLWWAVPAVVLVLFIIAGGMAGCRIHGGTPDS